jgi:hypothetical protein
MAVPAGSSGNSVNRRSVLAIGKVIGAIVKA